LSTSGVGGAVLDERREAEASTGEHKEEDVEGLRARPNLRPVTLLHAHHLLDKLQYFPFQSLNWSSNYSALN
jgi:hypothetical protein